MLAKKKVALTPPVGEKPAKKVRRRASASTKDAVKFPALRATPALKKCVVFLFQEKQKSGGTDGEDSSNLKKTVRKGTLDLPPSLRPLHIS